MILSSFGDRRGMESIVTEIGDSDTVGFLMESILTEIGDPNAVVPSPVDDDGPGVVGLTSFGIPAEPWGPTSTLGGGVGGDAAPPCASANHDPMPTQAKMSMQSDCLNNTRVLIDVLPF